MIRAYLLFPLLTLLVYTGCSTPNPLRCNIGVADITPEGSVVLAGFAAREGLSASIHRALKTRCIVIENDSARICIISNDMMELPISLADELRDEIALHTDIPREHIFIHATHTHSAPRVSGSSVEEGGTNHAFAAKFRETVVRNAIETANNKKAFVPFALEAGKGECFINCNRREKEGPCDHTLYLIHLVDKRGKRIASFLNFACHPVSLNHRSLVVSTDFPGIAVEKLSKEWGSTLFYFSGAAGNVNPCGELRADTAYTQVRGKELADAARDIRIERLKKSNLLRVSNRIVELPFRSSEITPEVINAHADEIKEWNAFGTWKDDVERWRAAMIEKIRSGEAKNYLPVGIAGVNIGGLILFFSQGEPFNEYQTMLRANYPDTPLLFIGYTNGQNSYFPSKYAYQRDGYEYEREQMHIYIRALYPLSDEMPAVYKEAILATVNDIVD